MKTQNFYSDHFTLVFLARLYLLYFIYLYASLHYSFNICFTITIVLLQNWPLSKFEHILSVAEKSVPTTQRGTVQGDGMTTAVLPLTP